MLSIYGKKIRPHHEMERIISLTSGYKEKNLKKMAENHHPVTRNIFILS
ncbi:Uncharacterised protein [Citrobacter koseri]|uniref:Uncharacterized protein n=1 Tax=Citrobacter koseri TaxID=545 RepID=A0A2X2X4B0_CITKO|nr:Uncharacterised protein [Citrobacter koseri]